MNRRHFLRKLIQSLAVLSSLSWVGMKVPEIQKDPAELLTQWSNLRRTRTDHEAVWNRITYTENERFLDAFYDTTTVVNRERLTLAKLREAKAIFISDSIRGERA